MNTISYVATYCFHPWHPSFKAAEDFNKLTLPKKTAVLFATIILSAMTIFVGTLASFRFFTGLLSVSTKKTDAVAQRVLHKISEDRKEPTPPQRASNQLWQRRQRGRRRSSCPPPNPSILLPNSTPPQEEAATKSNSSIGPSTSLENTTLQEKGGALKSPPFAVRLCRTKSSSVSRIQFPLSVEQRQKMQERNGVS